MRPGALAGVRVLVTRPETQARAMIEALRVAGAEPVAFPAIRIADPADGGIALAQAASRIDGFDWVVVSSANGAARLAAAVGRAGTEARARATRFAAVGPATAEALRRAGYEPALVAERHHGEGLVAALATVPLAGAQVLVAQAAGARRTVRDGLVGQGAEVVAVEAYRTVTDGRGAGEVRERLARGEIEVITFTSPSAVERLTELVGAGASAAVVAVIGPVTAAAAAGAGLRPRVIARKHTVPGLIEALAEHYAKESGTTQP